MQIQIWAHALPACPPATCRLLTCPAALCIHACMHARAHIHKLACVCIYVYIYNPAIKDWRRADPLPRQCRGLYRRFKKSNKPP